MQATFVETTDFTEWVTEFLPDDLYSRVQYELMNEPDRGAVMPGCGGLRKLRTADPRRGKGRRGGARLIYLYVPDIRCFYMVDIYGKDEKEDLSSDDKNALRQLADTLKIEAKQARIRSAKKGKK
ncbi:MAG: toxin HigB-2 [Planctomycetaceae bacterium]|nr:toxin HigB-2 [Planctomycetaceae bacterium]